MGESDDPKWDTIEGLVEALETEYAESDPPERPPSGLFKAGDRVGLKESVEAYNSTAVELDEVPAGSTGVLVVLINGDIWFIEPDREDLRRDFEGFFCSEEHLQFLSRPDSPDLSDWSDGE